MSTAGASLYGPDGLRVECILRQRAGRAVPLYKVSRSGAFLGDFPTLAALAGV